MTSDPLTLNILNFKSTQPQLCCYLLTQKSNWAVKLTEEDTLFFIQYLKLPSETEVLYTTFDEQTEDSIALTLNIYSSSDNDNAACWSNSFLKQYYIHLIRNYFKKLRIPSIVNFVGDIEVWVPDKSPLKHCDGFRVFQLRVQLEGFTGSHELLVSEHGVSSVYKEPLTSKELTELSHDVFNWVMYNNRLYRHARMPDNARRNLEQVFPCMNTKLRKALGIPAPSPDKSNKYIRFWNEISLFKDRFLMTDEFSKVIEFESSEWKEVSSKRLDEDQMKESTLLFGQGEIDTDPYTGIKNYGPNELTPKNTNILFFFICSLQDTRMAMTVHEYLLGNKKGFAGLHKFVHINYQTEKGWSIYFKNRKNPLPEIISELDKRILADEKKYVALYLSPFSKWSENEENKAIYYHIKEELLHRGIVSQVIDVDKSWGTYRMVENNEAVLVENFIFSLPNIAIALLAKLGGTPWKLKHNEIKELIIGISAFKSDTIKNQYLGSAFSFSNEGKFYGFDCFRKEQITELTGSILMAVREYCKEQKTIQRLIIHFYKTLSKRELAPIEKGLAELGLDIPVIVISINKTLSNDVVGFDLSQLDLMPYTGTYLSIGHEQYLLYNSSNQKNKIYNKREGYPFPIKLSIKKYPFKSLVSKPLEDASVPELLFQICQFSQLYWKSVSKQSLPVTLKYPEMLAQIVPHFQHAELPQTGKETLWFL